MTDFLKRTPTGDIPIEDTGPERKYNLIVVILFWVALSFIALAFAINYIVAPSFKNRLHGYLEKSLKTKVSLGKIEIGLLSGRIIANNLAIKNPPGFGERDLFTVKQISIKPDILLLLKKRIFTCKITLDRPYFSYYKLADKSSNLDFLINKDKKTCPANSFIIPADELLIKGGTLRYSQELATGKPADAEVCGLFIHIKNHKSPIGYIKGVPLFTRIKGKGYIPTDPKGAISFSGNINFTDYLSFLLNIQMDNISLTYFNNFYPENSPIQVTGGSFSAISQAECVKNQLSARPLITVNNLKMITTNEYSTSNVFHLPVAFVVDFFDIYKEKLQFTFNIDGSITDPKFHLEEVIAQNVSSVIGESIARTVSQSPELLLNLGDKISAISDKLRQMGISIGEGTVNAIKQLEKPVSEFIEGLRDK